MTHLDDDILSALLDGELKEGAARAHAASCAECGARLRRLREASAAFRRSGEKPMPAGLAERAKAAAGTRTSPREAKVRLVAAGVALFALILFAGAALKRLTPALFNNIQQMITGAASSMGSGGR